MKKLSKLFTIVFFFNITSSFALEQCEEVQVGKHRKALWKTSLISGLKGEIVNQIDKKDNLFESLAPEISYDVNPYLKLNLELLRVVEPNLPEIDSGTIKKTDIFTYQVKDMLHISLAATKSSGFFNTGASAGVNLVRTTEKLPGKDIENCRFLEAIIDRSTERGQNIFDASCTKRKKSLLTKWYEGVVNFFSGGVGKIFGLFVSSEKHKEFAKDPLSPLKLHSTLGIPLDYEVFFENNFDLAIGDMVEHTSFYNLNLIGVSLNPFEFFKPNYSRFQRYYRTLAFKKEYGNKVIVEIKDAVISGDSSEVFKIKPTFLGFIKINFGKWGIEKFKEESLLQKFEIDLNKIEGRKFFRKFLFMAYKPSVKMGRNTVLVDSAPYQSGVKAFNPVFRDGAGVDNRFVIKIPGVVSWENRNYKQIDKVYIDNKEYVTGARVHKRKFKNKLKLDFKILEIKKADREYECQMQVESNRQNALEVKQALNIGCSYRNEYATKNNVKKVIEHLDMVTNSNIENRDLRSLEVLNNNNPKKINMHTNLSFSNKELNKIIGSSDDIIYSEISKMIFGENSENIFTSSKHKYWQKLIRHLSLSDKISNIDETDCRKLFKKYKIIEKDSDIYTTLPGVVGRKKGFFPVVRRQCVRYFSLARSIRYKIRRIGKSITTEESYIDDFLNSFSSIHQSGMIQNLLLRLAGGLGSNKVHYSYIVSSEKLERAVIETNGGQYTADIPRQEKNIISQMSAKQYPRIEEVDYSINTCNKGFLKIKVEMKYNLDKDEQFYAKIRINKYRVGRSTVNIQKLHLPVNIVEEGGKRYLNIEVPLVSEYSWDNSHVVFMTLVNHVDLAVTNETKTYIKKLNELFEEE